MANDSILTRVEVEQERKSLAELDSKFGGDMKVDCFVAKQSELLNTITQAVELLERALRDLHVNPGDFESDETEMMIQAFLARYHAGAASPQPETSPPQK